ncbi:hypothetical protein [Methylomagnum sp.]
MLKSYEAIYDHGHIRWINTPPEVEYARAIITLLPELAERIETPPDAPLPPRQAGALKGRVKIAPDFNAPLNYKEQAG